MEPTSTLLGIKMEGTGKTSQSTSHCQYMLSDLVRDQGRSACEKRGHQPETGPEVGAQEHRELSVALDKLFVALRQIY